MLLHETHAHLWNNMHQKRIEQALQARYGQQIVIHIKTGQPQVKTPAEMQADNQRAAQGYAIDLIKDDANIKQLVERFNGTLELGSIRVRK